MSLSSSSETVVTTIPKTMKAVVVRHVGDAKDALQCETDYAVPEVKPGFVLVKNAFAGLNFIDTYYRKGLYQQPLPFVAGQEGGGQVVQVHPSDGQTEQDKEGAVSIQVGDTVVYMAPGSYAEYTLVPLTQVVQVPLGLDLQVAVASMIQALSAHFLVTSAHANLIGQGDWMLIYSVGSGTGQWAAQMAQLQGYRVIGTTSARKVTPVVQAACEELIVLEEAVPGATYADYTSVDIVARVMEITGGVGVKCILDGIGLSTYEISLACLAKRGIFVSFGNASGVVPPFPLLRLGAKSAFVTRPRLFDYIDNPKELQLRCHDVFTWIQQGQLQVKIDTVFSLDEAAKGHEYLESGQSKGKILYRI
ncbi:hypothetical protein ACA910_004355 [Epithemia clementina (nom. ined.)]